MDNEILVKTIRSLCQSNGVSISQLESDLEFGAGLISRWIKSSPSIDKIVDIADYFQVSLDDVVGYGIIINDKFLEKLIQQTICKSIEWHKYEKPSEDPKQYFNPEIPTFSPYIEISYFVKINNGYVSIYGCYEEDHNVTAPIEIKLFIQPDFKSQLIKQDYTYEQLKALWLKVLYSMGDNAPDEIRAEEFKNSFINDFEKPSSPNKKKKDIIFVGNHQQRFQKPYNAQSIKKQYKFILNEVGCVLYDLSTCSIVDTDDTIGVTNAGKVFYYKHKESLGKVTNAELIDGKELLLVSDSKIMKLSGFSWGKELGTTGFNGLLGILGDAGFDISNEDLKTKDNLTIYPISI